MKNSLIASIFGNLLSNPKAKMSAHSTDSGRQIIKVVTGVTNGITKRSAVRYPNGTIVETIVYKK